MPHPLYALPRVRERRRLSVNVLAERANVRARTVRRLERGRLPTYTSWRALAGALRVRPDTLMHLGAAADCPDCQAYQSKLASLT